MGGGGTVVFFGKGGGGRWHADDCNGQNYARKEGDVHASKKGMMHNGNREKDSGRSNGVGSNNWSQRFLNSNLKSSSFKRYDAASGVRKSGPDKAEPSRKRFGLVFKRRVLGRGPSNSKEGSKAAWAPKQSKMKGLQEEEVVGGKLHGPFKSNLINNPNLGTGSGVQSSLREDPIIIEDRTRDVAKPDFLHSRWYYSDLFGLFEAESMSFAEVGQSKQGVNAELRGEEGEGKDCSSEECRERESPEKAGPKSLNGEDLEGMREIIAESQDTPADMGSEDIYYDEEGGQCKEGAEPTPQKSRISEELGRDGCVAREGTRGGEVLEEVQERPNNLDRNATGENMEGSLFHTPEDAVHSSENCEFETSLESESEYLYLGEK